MRPTRALASFAPLAVALGLITAGPVAAKPTRVVELVQFASQTPESWSRMQRTSESPPLTLDELQALREGGVGQKTLIEMMRTRRVAAVADAETLLALKKRGAHDEIIAAVSAYAMRPNAFFELFVNLTVSSPDTVREAPFLYIEAWHTVEQRAVGFLYADLRGAVTGGLGVRVQRDRSDPLLPRTVRSVDFTGRVDTRKAGSIELRVLVTRTPGLRTLDGLAEGEAGRVRTFAVDYPAVSLEHVCRLRLVLERDTMMKDTFALGGGALDCRWE